ncbi:MAG: hypothetical protein J6L71_05570 [Clostridia bacterium]|nr:hypothetical protein [Clostridia bacterium]
MIEISVLIGVAGLGVSVATFFIGRTTAARMNGSEDGEMKSDIKHIKESIDKQEAKLDGIVSNYEDVKVELEKLKGRLYTLEQKVKILHGEG